MLCTNCGAELTPRAKFCGKCGSAIAELATNYDSYEKVAEKSCRQLSKKEIFIAAIKAAIISGDIEDASIVDKSRSSRSGNEIYLCDSLGRKLSRVSIARIEQLIDHPSASDKSWIWEDDVLEAWDRNRSQKLRSDSYEKWVSKDELLGEWEKEPSQKKKVKENPFEVIFGMLFKVISTLLAFALFFVFKAAVKLTPRAINQFNKEMNKPAPVYENYYK